MNCPKCKKGMEKITYQGHEVERCTGCKGLWFDLLEHEELKRLRASEKLDIGDSGLGAKQNKIEDYNCPKCSAAMVHLVDLEQTHIWYEACSVCYGVYFDAGEFKDYKIITLRDRIKSTLTEERK